MIRDRVVLALAFFALWPHNLLHLDHLTQGEIRSGGNEVKNKNNFSLKKIKLNFISVLVLLFKFFFFSKIVSSFVFFVVAFHLDIRFLLDATVAVLDEVLSPFVFGQIFELPAVDGPSPLSPDQVDGVFVLHAQFDQRDPDEDGCPAEPRDAVDSDARFGIGGKLGLDQVQPLVDDFRRRRRSVGEGEIRDVDAGRSEIVNPISPICRAHQVRHPVLLQDLDVVVDGGVLGLLGDEEPHVLELDLGRSRSDQLSGHGGGRDL